MSKLITPLTVVDVLLSALVCKGVSVGYQSRAVRSIRRRMAGDSTLNWGKGAGWVKSVVANIVGPTTCGLVVSADTQ